MIIVARVQYASDVSNPVWFQQIRAGREADISTVCPVWSDLQLTLQPNL